MKFFLRTLGCKMNWLDGAQITARLQLAGHTLVAEEGEAELVLVNTCTVTGEADRKSRQQATAAAREQRPVAVFGCGPKVEAGRWRERLPANAQVFDSEQGLLEFLGLDPDDEALNLPVASRTRLPVAIQTGCDNRCSFCITRVARGPHRSLEAAAIVRQIAQAAEAGVGEVVLTGINLGAWGAEDSTRADSSRLPALLERILRETAIPRIRISSLGPQYLSAGFYDLLADARLCDHLHLSVQSGSPAVLTAMDRGHGREEVLDCAERARRVRPHIALTADLITGFPGEGEREFEETLQLAQAARLTQLHVFPFSPREGTPAATLFQQVPPELSRQRAARLRAESRSLHAQFVATQMGRELEVLAELGGSGLTSNYLRLDTSGAERGSWVKVTVTPTSLVGGD